MLNAWKYKYNIVFVSCMWFLLNCDSNDLFTNISLLIKYNRGCMTLHCSFTDASDSKAIRPNILLLKYACTLVLQVINNDGTCYYNSAYLNDGVVLSLAMGELKRSLSALSLKNIIWLKNVCMPLKDIKGVEGYNIRAFLSSLPDDW